MTTPWLAATLALLVPFAILLLALARGAVPDRLAALQFATVIATLALAAMSFAFDQPATLDMALCLALLSLPGTLLFALFEERWL